MTFFPAHFAFALRRSRFALLALFCSAVLPVVTQAQEPPKQEKFYTTDRVSEELGKVRPLVDAKKWDEAIAFIDGLIKTAEPNSFDLVTLCNYKVQFLLNKGDYAKAIEPLETSLRLAEQFHYLESRVELELTQYLAQIYFQEAMVKNRTADQQQLYYAKAAEYAERFVLRTPNPTADNHFVYSSILYYWVISMPNNIDKGLLKKARIEIEKGLLLSIHSKEQHMQLLLAILIQEGDYVRCGELLELLVKQFPNRKTYWQQLQQVYFSLAGDKDPKKSWEYNIRAILTTERAQALGQLNTPKDNFNLVGIYINIQQYERAAELLQAGLKNGAIDNEQKNWEYLAMCYQQGDKELKAIEILKEATTHFPKSGALHFQIAQFYAQIEKTEQAYNAAVKALEIGNLEKPGVVYSYLAYWAFDLRKYDEALVAVNKAYEYPEAKKDPQLSRVKAAIEDSIKEREFNQAAIEGQPQQPSAEQKKQPGPKKQPEKKRTESL